MNNELWEQWDDCHHSPDQTKRMASAQKAACTPIELDRDMGAGVFKGSSGTHTTTLEHCTCIDFCRRKLPCKHMYRLAMELGLVNESYKSDPKAVIGPSHKEPLSETIERLEKLTKAQQELLHSITCGMNSKNPVSVVNVSPNLLCLIDAQLLSRSDDLPTILTGHKMADLRSLISSLGSNFKGSKKVDLVNYLLDNHSDQLKSIDLSYAAVELPSHIKYGKVNMYLHRKFDDDNVFWEDNHLGTPLLETDLPHDDVTDLLIQYGHYHR